MRRPGEVSPLALLDRRFPRGTRVPIVRSLIRLVLSLVVGGCLLTPLASARLIESWPYERLLKEADLVVIARATSAADCEDRTTDNRWKAPFLGVNTTFRVESVLKGKARGRSIRVLHFKLKDGVRIVNGPLLVSFRRTSLELRTKEGGKLGLGVPSYLLFLKVRKDGRYEPVSGRVDPELSVRELLPPLETRED
jgi:hypothetical protein